MASTVDCFYQKGRIKNKNIKLINIKNKQSLSRVSLGLTTKYKAFRWKETSEWLKLLNLKKTYETNSSTTPYPATKCDQ